MSSEKGKVYIVGGPGDPDLITIKAVNCLGLADVIVYISTTEVGNKKRVNFSTKST